MKKEIKNLFVVVLLVAIVGAVGYALYRQSDPVATTPVAEEKPPENLVRPDSPTLGPETAKVTIVEFLDPECESCAAFAPSVKKVMNEFGDDVRLVIRYMPFHKNSRLAASYLEAAGEQGRYWALYDKMLENQDQWGEIHGGGPQPERPAPATLFEKWAGELGMNVEQLKASAQDRKHLDKVERDFADGRALGVRGTPTFFVNGKRLQRLSEDALRGTVRTELQKKNS